MEKRGRERVRSPERIDGIVELLAKVWRRNPDLRLGQLIHVVSNIEKRRPDAFYVEDEEIERQLSRLAGGGMFGSEEGEGKWKSG